MAHLEDMPDRGSITEKSVLALTSGTPDTILIRTKYHPGGATVAVVAPASKIGSCGHLPTFIDCFSAWTPRPVSLDTFVGRGLFHGIQKGVH